MTKRNPIDLDPMATLIAVHSTLTRALESTQLNGDGEHPKTIQGIARLSESLVRLSGEVRQIQRQYKRDLKSYTVDELVAHIKSLPKRSQDYVLDELDAPDDDDDDPIDDDEDDDEPETFKITTAVGDIEIVSDPTVPPGVIELRKPAPDDDGDEDD